MSALFFCFFASLVLVTAAGRQSRVSARSPSLLLDVADSGWGAAADPGLVASPSAPALLLLARQRPIALEKWARCSCDYVKPTGPSGGQEVRRMCRPFAPLSIGGAARVWSTTNNKQQQHKT